MISKKIPEKAKILEAAERTGVFRPKEVDVLEELIDEMSSNKETTYRTLSISEGEDLAAFAIFGRTPLTDFSWDVYWLVVSPEYQGKGLGGRLMDEAERLMTADFPEAVIRVETSTRKEYAGARKFYAGKGYREVGTIEDFYSKRDGIVIYAKKIAPGKGGV
ncbi:MAG TPA: GNAT family N-acetyltransferase [Candidatus Omnitrophota bacterium]|nr:GNAT family N-acetyltransferase [Candidatus Omnitrophota bacterium]